MKQSSRKVRNSENLKTRQGTGATTIPGLFLIRDLVDSRLPHFRSEKQTGSSWAWPHTILTIELQIITFNQRGVSSKAPVTWGKNLHSCAQHNVRNIINIWKETNNKKMYSLGIN